MKHQQITEIKKCIIRGQVKYYATYLLFIFIFSIVICINGCSPKKIAYQPPQEPLRDHQKSKNLRKIEVVQFHNSTHFDSRLTSFLHKWEHVPYRLGGKNKRGVDCSALMQIAYNELYNKKLPRTAKEQAHVGRQISLGQLRKGDLVFFKTSWRGRHVGMFVGDNSFLHVSEQVGVTVSKLIPTPENKNSAAIYWSQKFWCARRLSSL